MINRSILQIAPNIFRQLSPNRNQIDTNDPRLTYTEIHGRTPKSHLVNRDGDLSILRAIYKRFGTPEFKCRRSKQDLDRETATGGGIRYIDDEFFIDAENLMYASGLSGAVVDFIRDSSGALIRGSQRTPLLILQGGRQLVLKPYDDYNVEREKRIIQMVSGKLGPKIFALGDQVFIEEFLDFDNSPTLLSLTKGQSDNSAIVDDAIVHAGRIHGQLAQLGIDYNHMHTMGEFRISPSGYKITDFGTSTLFLEPNWFDPIELEKTREKN